MATDLTFVARDDNKEYCEIKPNMPVVVQVIREEKSDGVSYFTVYANLEGLEPTTVFVDNIHKDFIFQIDVPDGVTVTMESCSHVISAKILQ